MKPLPLQPLSFLKQPNSGRSGSAQQQPDCGNSRRGGDDSKESSLRTSDQSILPAHSLPDPHESRTDILDLQGRIPPQDRLRTCR